MNYFELFEIPIALKVDNKSLARKYFELQKRYHPDYYGQGTPDEQEEALEISAQINQAFKTFQNPDATIKYVLQLRGLLEEEEKYQLPADFLMEVMELNELKMDGAAPEEIAARTAALGAEIKEEILPVLVQFGPETTDEALQAVKAYYYKKKYLDRLLEE